MTTPDAIGRIVELAARCEAATGADIQLDADIRDALGLPHDYSADWRGWGYDADGKGIEKPKAFPYTASIDAALSLVPEGCTWRLDFAASRHGQDSIGSAFVIAPPASGQSHHGDAATPALALCAAALRARATEQASDSGEGEA